MKFPRIGPVWRILCVWVCVYCTLNVSVNVCVFQTSFFFVIMYIVGGSINVFVFKFSPIEF